MNMRAMDMNMRWHACYALLCAMDVGMRAMRYGHECYALLCAMDVGMRAMRYGHEYALAFRKDFRLFIAETMNGVRRCVG